MKSIVKIFIIGVFITFSFSCEDFLTHTPSDAVEDTDAFNTANDIQIALNGAYNSFGDYRFYGRNVLALADIAADNMWMLGSSGHFDQIYQYTISADLPDLMEIWEYGYKVISQCARLIKAGKEMLASSEISDDDEEIINSSIAQAYALKALSHFTLVNIFGLPYSSANENTPGIVLIGEEPIAAFQQVQRSTVGKTYEHILNEIDSAAVHIDLASSSVFSFNTASLFALEARVKLYMGDFDGAITAAQNAISERGGALELYPENYVNMWFSLSPNTEDIFTIAKLSNDNLSANSLNTLYDSYDGKASFGLFALFDEDDMRIELFDDDYYGLRALKFDGLPTSRAASNVPVFRLPEMYLIIAEAKAQLGQSEAIDFVYEVAQRNPDLDKADIPTDKDELLDFISVERRRELFQEGHRWFDLRRTGEKMTRDEDDLYEIVDWDISKFVYPIPANEINASGIKQNENWNANLP